MSETVDGSRDGGPDQRVAELHAVLQYVRPLSRHVAQVGADRLDGTGISVGSRAVLERLAVEGALTVPHLGRALAFPRQVVQRMVNELLALKLVEPRGNPGHRRSHLFAVTSAGRQAIDDVRAGEDGELEAVARRFTPEQTTAAVEVMAALTDHFRRGR